MKTSNFLRSLQVLLLALIVGLLTSAIGAMKSISVSIDLLRVSTIEAAKPLGSLTGTIDSLYFASSTIGGPLIGVDVAPKKKRVDVYNWRAYRNVFVHSRDSVDSIRDTLTMTTWAKIDLVKRIENWNRWIADGHLRSTIEGHGWNDLLRMEKKPFRSLSDTTELPPGFFSRSPTTYK